MIDGETSFGNFSAPSDPFIINPKGKNCKQIKRELDALERTKDEESKRFQIHNIHFDFNILVQIKESLVDVSSSCMELALKVRMIEI